MKREGLHHWPRQIFWGRACPLVLLSWGHCSCTQNSHRTTNNMSISVAPIIRESFALGYQNRFCSHFNIKSTWCYLWFFKKKRIIIQKPVLILATAKCTKPEWIWKEYYTLVCIISVWHTQLVRLSEMSFKDPWEPYENISG